MEVQWPKMHTCRNSDLTAASGPLAGVLSWLADADGEKQIGPQGLVAGLNREHVGA